MRNTCRVVLLSCLAGCATTVSSYEVHYDRAEVSYVTAPVRTDHTDPPLSEDAYEGETSLPSAHAVEAAAAPSERR